MLKKLEIISHHYLNSRAPDSSLIAFLAGLFYLENVESELVFDQSLMTVSNKTESSTMHATVSS